jgi:hypothetical protein
LAKALFETVVKRVWVQGSVAWVVGASRTSLIFRAASARLPV